MVNISIILPVYNVDSFLSSTLDSILAQSYDDWELILVDDGSTDGSAGICDDYSSSDNRIRCVHKPNQGVSAARNKGIDMAGGEFITFVDGDDTLRPNYLQTLREAMTDGIDLVNASWESGGEKHQLPDIEVETIDSMDGVWQLWMSGHNLGYVWGKLFRTDIIRRHNISFPVGVRWAEDVIFVNEYLSHARNIKLLSTVVYDYTLRPGSSVGRLYDPQSEWLGFVSAQRLQRSLNEKFPGSTTCYFSPHAYLRRYVCAVLRTPVPKKEKLGTLRKIEFDKKVMHSRPENWREAIFDWLLINKKWRLMLILTKNHE